MYRLVDLLSCLKLSSSCGDNMNYSQMKKSPWGASRHLSFNWKLESAILSASGLLTYLNILKYFCTDLHI